MRRRIKKRREATRGGNKRGEEKKRNEKRGQPNATEQTEQQQAKHVESILLVNSCRYNIKDCRLGWLQMKFCLLKIIINR